ncbi:MAG: hypothetical protein JWP83_3027, partial [Mycobacterium sp.]|nr:hypothetical protein [Mycobacterium sp.]
MASHHDDSGAPTALAGQRTPQKHVHHTIGQLEGQLMARLDGKIAVITGGSSG